MEVSAIDKFQLTLRGTELPNGDVSFAALHRITGSMQQLATRVGRNLVGKDGPGRSPTMVEQATSLRLRGEPREGSTILDVVIGPDQLFDRGGLDHNTLDQMFALLDALAAGSPPPEVTPQIGTAVVQVGEALAFSADRCEFTSEGRQVITMATRSLVKTLWPTEPDAQTRAETVVTGRLELVDLRRARFRVRDAVGNDITLNDVEDADEAARYVGQQVTALGEGSVGARGQISSINDARISAAEVLGWTMPTLDLAAATAPPMGGIPWVTDADVDEFLAMIRE